MEELIEAVRPETCLYDVKHPDYINTKLKYSIWKRIAEALNLKNATEAKRSWEKLRNNHRDALRRQKNLKPKRGSETVYIKPWRFQEKMEFLVPHMANRYTNKFEESQNDGPSQTYSDAIEEDIQGNVTDNLEFRASNEENSESSESQSTDISVDPLQRRKRHKRNSLNNLLNRPVEEHQRGEATRPERERLITSTTNDFTISNVKNDPLFHFFMSMYETTKRLPSLSQHTIKTNIFSSVCQEEAKTLVKYSPRPHSSNSHTSE